jgi:predicted helicase
MPLLRLEANHKAIRNYYRGLKNLSLLDVTHEGAVRTAFQELLGECARRVGWNLVTEHPLKRPNRPDLHVDGAVVDNWNIPRGYWEAKDEHDDLNVEVKKKIALGYPTNNILFQAPNRAILYQNGRQVLDGSLETADKLIEVLREFFRYQAPEHDQWELAAEEFKSRVPDLARALLERIEKERQASPRFVKAFAGFFELCRRSINPNLSEQAVEEMLIQHILTERIFRKVFDSSDFVRRNPIAAEIENVVDALTSRAFNRDKFLSELDRFYRAIEKTAATIEDFNEKQHFLNTVYEKFFQGFSVKIADTHGIVYTPQPIVRFMVRSVDEILRKEFGKSLGSKGVHIIDPFVGTGNFILHVMRQIPRTQLAHKYENELHANEVMLLPYYIASLNIEHEYSALMDEYKPFEGLCLVDTFELAEDSHPALFTEKNTERVERQRKSPIFVVMGNPPYNAWQVHENDKNKNRKYPTIDGRVSQTYGSESTATLLNSLQDPYVNAFRWATDRIRSEGIVAFVTNSNFIDGLAFDGMRKCLTRDFDALYVLDLGGNVRRNPKLSGTTHNVFGIQVGVSISLLIRRSAQRTRLATIKYASLDEFWRKEQKLQYLNEKSSYVNVHWKDVFPNQNSIWLTEGLQKEFDTLIPMHRRSQERAASVGIFLLISNGVKSNNDSYVYDFNKSKLTARARRMVAAYNDELRRWRDAGRPANVDDFVRIDESVLKWIFDTKQFLSRNLDASFVPTQIRSALFRPYVREHTFFSRFFNNRLYQIPLIFPTEDSGKENRAIIVKTGAEWPMFALVTDRIPDLLPQSGSQVFAFYVYDYDGSGRRENITDEALAEFRKRYDDDKITKWDIFHYVYALLHHPSYRHKYKANLKRELPRIPCAPDFWAFARAGKRLAEIHVDYEKQPEYELERIENPEAKLSWRTEKMRLNKQKNGIVYNDFLTLGGVPPEVFEYRLGNRSALEWVIDQYQVSTDQRSGITNDPNRPDDPEYIVRLIGQVITVSLETVKLIRALPPCETGGPSAAEALAGTAMQAEEAKTETAPEEPDEVQKAEPRVKGSKRTAKVAGSTKTPQKETKGTVTPAKASKVGTGTTKVAKKEAGQKG